MNRLKKYLVNGLMLSCASILIRAISVSFNVYLSGKTGAGGMGAGAETLEDAGSTCQ